MVEARNKLAFVPSVSTRYIKSRNIRVPSIDLTPAAKFGELVEIVQSPVVGDLIDDIKKVQEEIRKSYDPERGDYIVAAGHPVLIAAAIHEASKEAIDFGDFKVNVLCWDRMAGEYAVKEVTFE